MSEVVVMGFKERWRILFDREAQLYFWYMMDGHGRWVQHGCVCCHTGPLKYVRGHVR